MLYIGSNHFHLQSTQTAFIKKYVQKSIQMTNKKRYLLFKIGITEGMEAKCLHNLCFVNSQRQSHHSLSHMKCLGNSSI